MVINIIILVVVLCFLFFYYKETVIVLAPISQFIDSFRIPYFSYGGLFGPIALVILILFPFKFNNIEKEKERFSYPFKLLTLMVILSYLLSDFGKHLPTSAIIVISVYIYPIILWKCINTPEKGKLFVKSLIIYLTCVCLYAFYELFTNSNPLIEYFSTNNIAIVQNSDRVRYGFKRIQSFLTYNGTLGCTCGLGFAALVYLKIHFKQYLKVNNLFLLTLIFALCLCVIFTGTRSVIAGLLVGSLVFLDPQLLRKYKSRYILFIIGGLILLRISEISGFVSQIVESFQNTESAGGSSTGLREYQLNYALFYWSKAPLFGNGTGFSHYLTQSSSEDIFGLESIWFKLLIDYGTIGCMVFVFSILFPVVKLLQSGMSFLIFLPLLFLVDKSLSLIPGVSIGFHLVYVVFFLRVKAMSTIDRQGVLL